MTKALIEVTPFYSVSQMVADLQDPDVHVSVRGCRMSNEKAEALDLATNRLSLAYDVESLARLAKEWAVAAAEAYEGDPKEWLIALADEMGVAVGDADGT
jgi:hypothetical protein